MTAEAFRNAVKNNTRALKEWFYDEKNSRGILHQTRASSKDFIDASRVDFILTKEQLVTVVGNETTADAIFATMQADTSDPTIEYQLGRGQETIIFRDINFRNLNKTIAKYLENIAEDAGLGKGAVQAQAIEAERSLQRYDKGHVYGWANTLVERTRESITEKLKDSRVPPDQLQKELDALNSFIDSLHNLLEQYDEAASGITDITADVYAKYRKTSTNWLITWHGAAEQQAGGGKVGTIIGKSNNVNVRGFLKNVVLGSSDKLVEDALTGMVNSFVKEGIAQQGAANLLQLKSSPPILDMIVDDLTAALTGKPKKLKPEYTGDLPNLAKLPIRRVLNKQAAKASVKKVQAELMNLKGKVRRAKAKVKQAVLPFAEVNLLSLTNLLNLGLAEQIRQNMGTGDRRDVLNYRTGRFANSANVERLTMSKQGMITAFYTYMKNPYATFSVGGKQQFPRSRDPKLLISKSIRELAAQQVSNQLRAVQV
jgi:hypothetical protein